MKVLILTICCVIGGCAASGAVAWPGAVTLSAPLLKTFYPGQTKTTAYSTTQYINSLPASYTFGAPQFAYQVPQVSSFSPLQPHYYQVAGSPFYPATNIFYPTSPIGPAPGSVIASVPGIPSFPTNPAAPANPGAPMYPNGQGNEQIPQPAGDSDSDVIDSAFPSEQREPQQPMEPNSESSQPPAPEATPAQPAQPALPQFPINTYPNFPSFPQIPQGTGQIPSFPQFPQTPQFPQVPQFPEGPQFPQVPQLPQFPPSQAQQPTQTPPSSFPGASNDEKGINDADTISVESA